MGSKTAADIAEQYLEDARAAEAQAANASDPQFRDNFSEIARIYRLMAQRMTQEDEDITYSRE